MKIEVVKDHLIGTVFHKTITSLKRCESFKELTECVTEWNKTMLVTINKEQ
jgi:hypothetical protein